MGKLAVSTRYTLVNYQEVTLLSGTARRIGKQCFRGNDYYPSVSEDVLIFF